MKKALSILLSATMIFSIYLPTFAEETEAAENKTTITATVANHDPSYTLHIPAATTITQDVTTAQELDGKVYVTDLSYMDGKKVTCTPTGTALKKSDSNDTITTAYLYKTATGMTNPSEIAKFDCGVGEGNGTSIYAQVEKSAWDAAPNGSYSATITFEFAVDESEKSITVGDLVKDSMPIDEEGTAGEFMVGAWVNSDGKYCFLIDVPVNGLYLHIEKGYQHTDLRTDTVVESDGNGNYLLENAQGKFTFVTENNTLKSLIAENTLEEGLLDGTYVAPTN